MGDAKPNLDRWISTTFSQAREVEIIYIDIGIVEALYSIKSLALVI